MGNFYPCFFAEGWGCGEGISKKMRSVNILHLVGGGAPRSLTATLVVKKQYLGCPPHRSHQLKMKSVLPSTLMPKPKPKP